MNPAYIATAIKGKNMKKCGEYGGELIADKNKNETNSLLLLVRQAGLEPATYGLEGRCSILLSYWRG